MTEAVKTGHPHIVRLEGACGGEPVIDGLRVTVRHVVTRERSARRHGRRSIVPSRAQCLD